MKIERHTGSAERALVIGCVVSRPVLAAVAANWDGKLFRSRWSNLIVGWCVDYHTRYRKAPGRNVETLFDRWAESGNKDKDAVRLIEKLLSDLSGQYESHRKRINPDLLIDTAGDYFDVVRGDALADDLAAAARANDPAKIRTLVEKYRSVQMGVGTGVNVFDDESTIQSAFESVGETLIQFGQPALDAFFAHTLAKDCFVALMAKEKGKKSFVLQEIAFQAVRCGRNVAFFEVGDQSLAQIVRRFAARAAGRPFMADTRVRIPTAMETGNPPTIDYETKTYDRPMSWGTAVKAMKRFGEKHGADKLKLSVHPNSSISVTGVESVLDGWKRDGWVPDIIIVDYSDLLQPMNNRDDSRDQINATWKGLRRLSQQTHCLVVTATQADSGAYLSETLSRRNFADDKRKYGHVTGMVGINQTADEMEKSYLRLNWIVGRDLEFSESRCVFCATCLPLANPLVLSTF